MQIMTVKQAKNNFGELTKSLAKEPVIITKNNKPIGAFVSLQDLDRLMQDINDEYEQLVYQKLASTFGKIEQGEIDSKDANPMFYDNILKQALAQHSQGNP